MDCIPGLFAATVWTLELSCLLEAERGKEKKERELAKLENTFSDYPWITPPLLHCLFQFVVLVLKVSITLLLIMIVKL